MKKIVYLVMGTIMMGVILQGCASKEEVKTPDSSDLSGNVEAVETTDTNTIEDSGITKEIALEGVNNYCHSNYDWSGEETVMYVEMGEETDTEYQVIFRSYTGAYVYFYVDKTNGMTRMVDYVPTLDVEEEAGMINIFDYLDL